MVRCRATLRPHLALILLWSVLFPLTGHATQDVKPTSSDRDRGIALYRQQRTSEAIAALRRVVAADKQDHEAWYYLGLSQIQDDDFKAASKSFENALALQPTFAVAHAALAFALLQRNKTTEASREAQRALNLDATIADAYYVLGVTRMWAGANMDAVEFAQKAIKLQPEFAPSYLLKAEALIGFIPENPGDPEQERELRKERWAQATAALEKYLQIAPNAPKKEFWRGQLEALKAAAREPPAASQREIFTSKEVSTRARVLKKPEPQYTSAARENGVQGTVVLRAVFAADGAVKHIFVVRGLPHGMTEICIEAARRIKFVPATKDGKPVSMWMQLEYNFNVY